MKQVGYLLILMTVIFFLWESPVLVPLKLLVVFFHESSHALMAVATGGEVSSLVVNSDQGGHVIARGGSRFLTLSAGYLGSLCWGMAIFLASTRTRMDKSLMMGLGVAILVIAVLYVRNLFGLGFSLLAGGGMIFISRQASEAVNDFVLRLIGLTNMMYAPLDIYSDTVARSHLRSDARMLAEEVGGATVIWGGVWIAISVYLIAYCLRVSLRARGGRW
ncbi:MAG: M50 family metallopeptidase [Candidatus Nitrohelix vancouverensis]|uniref:M50 family metallopeptidase n=1 Tax=Candidatus Nitrohelix vancouverensis TaxID=2705534 RepID=A0A7T0C2T3_9BACT|nr:MAG: M50 family metallopeptidase [Candidatus Nitrohelix vancouverensis]